MLSTGEGCSVRAKGACTGEGCAIYRIGVLYTGEWCVVQDKGAK